MKSITIAAYLASQYPFKGELSKARLTKLVYLVDWFHCLTNDCQATNIKWQFHQYGPYVDDVVDEIRSDSRFRIEATQNHFGFNKDLIIFSGSVNNDSLPSSIIAAANKAIDETKTLYWNDFIKYIYNTPPVKFTERFAIMDLEKIAADEKSRLVEATVLH